MTRSAWCGWKRWGEDDVTGFPGAGTAYLVVEAGRRVLALDAGCVREVLFQCALGRPPTAPPFLAGLLDLAGEAVPVVALAELLGLAAPPCDRYSQIVLAGTEAGPLGLAVTRARTLVRAADAVREEVAPGTSFAGCVAAALSWPGGQAALLALDRLLIEAEIPRPCAFPCRRAGPSGRPRRSAGRCRAMTAALRRDRAGAPPDAMDALRDFVVERTGLAYYRGRERKLVSVVQRAMRRAGTPTRELYFALVRSERGRAELETLISELVIGETSFFRHPAQFAALRDAILPALDRARPPGQRLRIWSAACANGAEPASLALLVGREARLGGRGADILGTDLSQPAVRRARRMVFGVRDRRGLAPRLDRACFEDVEDGRRLAEAYRRMLRFRQHNLMRASHPEGARGAPFDLVLCRNVLIYFDAPTVRRVLANIRATMAPDGWLMVGHAEPLLACHDLFRPEWVGEVFAYRPADKTARRARPAQRERSRPVPAPFLPPPATAAGPVPKVAAPLPVEDAAPSIASIQDLLRQGDGAAARRACRARVEACPFDAQSHYMEALVADWAGEPAAAETALRRALFLDRKFGPARFRLSQLLMARGDGAGALRELRNVARLYHRRDADEIASEIDGLTVGALRDLVALQLESVAAP